MPEIYINIMVLLVIFVVLNYFRTKYASRISISVQKGIYIFAIAYFLFITIYYFNNFTNNNKRIFLLIFGAIFITYFGYKLKNLGNKTSH
jgi:hypothetical protein